MKRDHLMFPYKRSIWMLIKYFGWNNNSSWKYNSLDKLLISSKVQTLEEVDCKQDQLADATYYWERKKTFAIGTKQNPPWTSKLHTHFHSYTLEPSFLLHRACSSIWGPSKMLSVHTDIYIPCKISQSFFKREKKQVVCLYHGKPF